MNKLLVCCVLCVTAVGSGAQVQQQREGDRVTIPAPGQGIELPAMRYRMDRVDFDEFRGRYELANGQTLTISSPGMNRFAEIDSRGKQAIVATGPNTFVALDRQLKIHIVWNKDGSVGGAVHMVVPRSGVAGGPDAQLVTLALR